jgi:hypothetical protein
VGGITIQRDLNRILKGSLAAVPRMKEALFASAETNATLRSLFAIDVSLFRCQRSGTKVGVALTGAKDFSTCLFSNYNGNSERPKNYQFIRPRKIKEEMTLGNA